jgi:hypothetical protein
VLSKAGYTVKIAAFGPADQTAMITSIVTPRRYRHKR